VTVVLTFLALYQLTAFMWFFDLNFCMENVCDVEDFFVVFVLSKVYKEERESYPC